MSGLFKAITESNKSKSFDEKVLDILKAYRTPTQLVVDKKGFKFIKLSIEENLTTFDDINKDYKEFIKINQIPKDIFLR